MARTTFQGPVRSLNGFYTQGQNNVVNITSSTALTVADHAGKILKLNASTGATITLPAINAANDAVGTGPGSDPNTLNNVGVTFTFLVETAVTSGTLKIITGSTSDYIVGLAASVVAGGTSVFYVSAPATNRAINMTSGSGNGQVGGYITLTCVGAGKWSCGASTATVTVTTATTPFAAS